VFPDEGSQARYDRLARVLSDGQGPEVLAELLKARIPDLSPGAAAPGGGELGVWTVRDSALHRTEDPDCDDTVWSDVAHVPPAGDARRVVLLGESTARGWPFDPAFNCAMALQRALTGSGQGAFQVVDLAKTRATAAEIAELAAAVPALDPDVVVVLAGNNINIPPGPLSRVALLESVEVQDRLADAVRTAGYAGLRDTLVEVADARCRRYLDLLDPLAEGGARIVLVVPEFNLAGWVPDHGVEIPMFPGEILTAWYDLLDDAGRAAADERWDQVVAIAEKMAELDAGTSPLPGHLAGHAARRLGDAGTARRALEASRDAGCSLLLSCVPRVTRRLQELMTAVAAERGWECVDLRALLADPQLPGLPALRWFHDYCHLSDIGIERAMAAVADAVLGTAPGTTPPGPGVSTGLRAFAGAHAGAHLAYLGQPEEIVLAQLRSAVEGDPGLAEPLTAIRDVLSGPTPRWTNPAARRLLDVPPVRSFLAALAQTDGLPAGLWTLRSALATLLGPETTHDGDDVTDMLLGPHCGGHALPNFTQARCHHHATTRESRLFFALDRPRPATLELTYRMAAALPGTSAVVTVNGNELAALPSASRWVDTTVAVPASATLAGVNRFGVRWPIPYEDAGTRHAEDAAALARGQFPYVLPLFGELFTARARPGPP
jgi:hypothetical protein